MDTALRNPKEMLEAARFVHLKDDEQMAYIRQNGDPVTLARIKAHLKLCLICQRRNKLLLETASQQPVVLKDASGTPEDKPESP